MDMGELAANQKPIRLKPKQVLKFPGFALKLGPHQIASDLVLESASGGKPWIEWDRDNPHIGTVVMR